MVGSARDEKNCDLRKIIIIKTKIYNFFENLCDVEKPTLYQ